MRRFEYECRKHGRVVIEIERPPIKFRYMAYCPFCLETARKPAEDKQKWQPNWQAKEAGALA